VPAGEERGQQALDDAILAHDHPLHLEQDLLELRRLDGGLGGAEGRGAALGGVVYDRRLILSDRG
jgi:hypothetical protein